MSKYLSVRAEPVEAHATLRQAQGERSALKPITQAKLWYAQRISAMVLALCVLMHLVIILIAVKGGLSGAEILSRTRGSVLTLAFYGVFVMACAVHAPIGVMKILTEWTTLSKSWTHAACAVFGVVLLIVGGLAVWGVYRG